MVADASLIGCCKMPPPVGGLAAGQQQRIAVLAHQRIGAQHQPQVQRAVAKVGQPIFKLNSGAGHDAMKIHTIMPQAMLFVRGGNRGISHNPLEIITAEDAELATQAFLALLDEIN